ncbi:Pentapeptide repeats (9 copies) [Leishmania donovani]|uniref:Pentapeptide_repeats_(9_copies)_putative/Pfam:PF1 3599 n=1 Tax=Leishmania donovani TaxID=5661 RepID=A0A6J8FCL8_LEIDO|nr:Pentapeptide repeats (9 copies) [Leishmania donovani]VDZ45521.1 Pentapeptide_repeats_(9_copies)_putative/Pfam:PF13599 [Leishmania donovani]
MLLRESFTAVRRLRGAVAFAPLRLTAVCTIPRYSTVQDGRSCREQTHPRRHQCPSRNSVAGVHQRHHRHHARSVEPCARFRGAAPSSGRRGKSRTRSEAHVLHEATLRPSRFTPMRATRAHDATCTSPYELNTAQMLDAVLALSSALYEDEAAATAARVNDAKAPSNAADHPVSSPHVPPMTSYRALGELEGVTAVPEDAYGSLDAEDLMTSMGACSEGCGDKRDKRTLHIDLATNSPAPSFSSAVIAQPSSTGTTSSSIVATFAARDVPLERKVLQFMDLCSNSSATPHLSGDHSDAASQLPWNGGAGARAGDSRRDRTTPSAATAWSSSAAAALVLPGLDMKAILAHGVLENRHLRGLSLVRCDFSLVRWSHVTLEDCDLSRSLFYGAKLDTVIFRRCNFTGCILKGVQCRPSLSTTARFEDCDFRLAAVGLTCIPHDSRQTGKDADQGQGIICSSSRRDGPSVCFLRCNFDLSDFQFSQGLDKAKFVKCSNTRSASRFPLRVRGGLG